MSQSFSPAVQRRAVGALFFMHGISFSSWASQIPYIQQRLGLSDVQLGFLLFAIPAGRFITMPFSGFLITHFGSRTLVITSILLCALILLGLGLIEHEALLMFCLFLFGMCYNIVIFSLNMQAVVLEKIYQRSIMASFHGLWSLAGFAGSLLATLLIARGLQAFHHFLLVSSLVIANVLFCAKYLPQEEKVAQTKKNFFTLPKGHLLLLGLIAFCSLICEGGMYDWSGIYFSKIVKADKEWLGLGYASFMGAMATGRFFSDWYVTKFGLRNTFQVSGALLFSGLALTIAFPSIIPSTLGFVLVGFGVSSVIPLAYAAAGRDEHVLPQNGIVMVSTVGFLGFMIGPPLIGMLAGLASLRLSFCLMAIMGLGVFFLGSKLKS